MLLYNANGSKFKLVKLEERKEALVRFYEIQDGKKVLITEADLADDKATMVLDKKYIDQKNNLQNPAEFYWTIADQNGKDFDMIPERPFAYTSGKMLLYNANGSKFKLVKLEERKEALVRFYEIQDGKKVLIAEAVLPEDGSRATIALDQKYLDMGNNLADSSKFHWAITDQGGNDFAPKNQYEGPSFTRVKNTMIIYREGTSNSKMVNLTAK